jgi:hypothetical protein
MNLTFDQRGVGNPFWGVAPGYGEKRPLANDVSRVAPTVVRNRRRRPVDAIRTIVGVRQHKRLSGAIYVRRMGGGIPFNYWPKAYVHRSLGQAQRRPRTGVHDPHRLAAGHIHPHPYAMC